jgi:hypothetical protein
MHFASIDYLMHRDQKQSSRPKEPTPGDRTTKVLLSMIVVLAGLIGLIKGWFVFV